MSHSQKPVQSHLSAELIDQLNFLADKYNDVRFITHDPIQIPHRFSRKEDIEISGFLAATIAWGNRVSIIKSATRLIEAMDHAPYDFVTHHQPADLRRFEGFVHRTMNEIDVQYFLSALQRIYGEHQDLEAFFVAGDEGGDNLKSALTSFHERFFTWEHLPRTRKHLSNPSKGSAAKRLNMFLRWMVRRDQNEVDFGIWQRISPSRLSIPLDVHTGNQARRLGLLGRKQNDWKAVEELDSVLKAIDPQDPVRFDYALFGLGIERKSLKGSDKG
ncbi:MAG: TIGR02757 family protein [Flavobacteriales bacterium]|nr:TIGR02757 family protein [Flavobacteriales bacterium]